MSRKYDSIINLLYDISETLNEINIKLEKSKRGRKKINVKEN